MSSFIELLSLCGWRWFVSVCSSWHKQTQRCMRKVEHRRIAFKSHSGLYVNICRGRVVNCGGQLNPHAEHMAQFVIVAALWCFQFVYVSICRPSAFYHLSIEGREELGFISSYWFVFHSKRSCDVLVLGLPGMLAVCVLVALHWKS